jgi:hypothetical protein
LDFVNNLDEIQISATVWDGEVPSVDQFLSSDQVSVTTSGLCLSFDTGHVLEVRGIFDASLLYDDLSIVWRPWACGRWAPIALKQGVTAPGLPEADGGKLRGHGFSFIVA